MKPFREFVEQRAKERAEATVTMYDKEVLISTIPDKSVGIEAYRTLRGNSLAYELMIPKYTDECLAYVARHYAANCSRRGTSTYDGALVEFIVPEMAKRLERDKHDS